MPAPSLLRTRSAAALFALALGTLAASATEKTTQLLFPVTPGGHLVLEVDRGSVTITTADTNSIGFTAIREVKGSDAAKTDQMLERHPIRSVQEGNTVTIRVEKPADAPRGWGRDSLKASYHVTVPKEFHLRVRTSGGGISVDNITGQLDLETSGGSISVGDVGGPVTARTSGGSIRTGTIRGPLDASTSGGSIRIAGAGGKVSAETSGGNIDLADCNGPVQAETSGGSIRATFTQSPAGDISLETSGGGITVSLPESASVNLDAETSGGRVTSDLPVAGTRDPSRSELRGAIGAGGPRMRLETSGGGIRILASTPPAR